MINSFVQIWQNEEKKFFSELIGISIEKEGRKNVTIFILKGKFTVLESIQSILIQFGKHNTKAEIQTWEQLCIRHCLTELLFFF